jgi:predicted metal-dependent phosphoesterase TrpH
MTSSITNLVLAADAAVDLQTHTINSDGTWTPQQLINHLSEEGFGLAAVTDHDRLDTIPAIQTLAMQNNFPILPALEMTCSWKDEMTDVLCFAPDPEGQALKDLTQDILHRQRENTRSVFEGLLKKGYTFSEHTDELASILEKPGSQQPHALVELLKKHGHGTAEKSVGKILAEEGCTYITNEIAAVINAAHQAGAVCLIAHPGRTDGFITYDIDLLDQLRSEVPLDGVEVYYPAHSAEQTTMYEEYVRRHHLLTSSGSDSHGPEKKPIKYRAELSRALLERVGIQIK